MIPVVISGGSGTRLWPVSRESFPKQFCDLFDESLQSKTLLRLKEFGQPWTLTVESMKVLSEKTLKNLRLPIENVIYEPFGCNTAPAIALLCEVFFRKGLDDEVVGVFPADHLVADQEAFREVVGLAEECAKLGDIVTLGIRPTYPATGYGYIETTSEKVKSTVSSLSAFVAKRFVEKPNAEIAQKYVEAGNFSWNAGMFIFKVSEMREMLSKFTPETFEKISNMSNDFSDLEEIYSNLERVSIDVAVMEKLDRLICIPSDIGWSDVGSWEEMARIKKETSDSSIANGGTVVSSDTLAVGSSPATRKFETESKNNFVMGDSKKIYSLIGVQDLVVVDTPDALLISEKGETQKVKDVVEELKKQHPEVTKEPQFSHRPWGRYDILADSKDFKAKIITVEPEERLSYQSHEKRDEHWIVVSGAGKMTIDDVESTVKAGDHVFIPRWAKHRIQSIGEKALRFVEVQLGEYFGEDDIKRYGDDYGRG